MNTKNKRIRRQIVKELERMEAEEVSPEMNPYRVAEVKPREMGPTLREKAGRASRNLLAIILCILIPALWYFDWNLSAFANRTSEIVTGFFDDGYSVQQAPAVSVPGLPGITGEVPIPDAEVSVGENAPLDMNITEYMVQMREAGYTEQFSSTAITAFYQGGVSVEYLDALNEAGLLEGRSFAAILTFYQTGVTVEYLNLLNDAGYLERYTFPAIATFYSSGVPVDFLEELNEQGLLEDLSFSEILILFENR